MLRIQPSLIGVVAEDVAGYIAPDRQHPKPILRQGAARSRDAAVTIIDSRTSVPRSATSFGSGEADRDRPHLQGTGIEPAYPTASQRGSEDSDAERDPFRPSTRQDTSYSPSTASLPLAYQPKRDSAIAVPRTGSCSPQSPDFLSYSASPDEISGSVEKKLHLRDVSVEPCTTVLTGATRRGGNGLRRYHARSCSDPSEPPPLRYKPVTSRKDSADHDKLPRQDASGRAVRSMLEQPSCTIRAGPYSPHKNGSVEAVEELPVSTTHEPRRSSRLANISTSTSSLAGSLASTSAHRLSNSTPFDQTFGNVPSPLEQLAKEASSIPSSSWTVGLPIREAKDEPQDTVPFPSFEDSVETEPSEGYRLLESGLSTADSFTIDNCPYPPVPRLRRSLGRRRSRTPALRANTISSHEGEPFRTQEVEAGLVRQHAAARRRVNRSNSEQENGEEVERFSEERRAWAAQRQGSQGGVWEHTPPRQGRLEQFL